MHTFICPVDGIYVFQSAFMAESRDVIETAIVLEGAESARIYAAGESDHGYDQGFNALVTLCKHGHHVWVHTAHPNSRAVYPGNFSTFSGFLLWEVEYPSAVFVG